MDISMTNIFRFNFWMFPKGINSNKLLSFNRDRVLADKLYKKFLMSMIDRDLHIFRMLKNQNSGILIHCTQRDKFFPLDRYIQLHKINTYLHFRTKNRDIDNVHKYEFIEKDKIH